MRSVDLINRAIIKLKEMNVKPTWIRMSPQTHDFILEEIRKRDGKKPSRLFEICGLKVIIEPECPAQGAYLGGKDDEDREEETQNVIGRGKRI